MSTMTRGGKLLAALSFLVAFAGLSGCASEVVRHPVELVQPAQSPPRAIRLVEPARFILDAGYERRLAAGTTFVEFGHIPQGEVYRPTSTVLTVEGAHIHEAFPVLRGNQVVGFYLPGDKAFSPLSQPIPLQLETIPR
jgi:hypothetical protein